MQKEKLSKGDAERITNLFELMCVVDVFDLDIQYMLSDLAILCKLEDFDFESFRDLAFKFLRKDIDSQGLLNFVSILYLLLARNKKLRDDEMLFVLEEFSRKIATMPDDDAKMAQLYAKSAIKLIKT